MEMMKHRLTEGAEMEGTHHEALHRTPQQSPNAWEHCSNAP